MAIERISEVADAYTAGRFWTGVMRRSGPALTANVWADMSYAAGNPVANYYAASPLTSTALVGADGIDVGPAPASGMKKYIHKFLILPPSGTNIGISEFMLNDVCLFYPFIDGDGGPQDTTANAVLTRYNGGHGCRVMVVSQGGGIGTSNVVVTYTNSAGVAGRTCTATLNFTAPPGSLVSCCPANTSYQYPCGPFLPMQNGDAGVRSIENVNVLSGAGGIAAFVIVRPLVLAGSYEALTLGVAAPIEVDLIRDKLHLEEVDTGAYLGVLARGTTAGTPAITSAQVTTIWG